MKTLPKYFEILDLSANPVMPNRRGNFSQDIDRQGGVARFADRSIIPYPCPILQKGEVATGSF
ncbi:MAG: hypothetical protein FWC08_06045 [Defluviitaleaceae bacterium]|nr:hypothetical protein [Defluviitaleaceae bacterium]